MDSLGALKNMPKKADKRSGSNSLPAVYWMHIKEITITRAALDSFTFLSKIGFILLQNVISRRLMLLYWIDSTRCLYLETMKRISGIALNANGGSLLSHRK